ncbi:bifunctional 3-(3-hydroxy-phenyl)propionate/3-hydroxycinnamic acid hydroxylase [Pseudomonas sp. GCM10022188]|uniref:bifunctional 3-(3-hydroxy-phenyl)propionate/3-hydroxycinnamic acid hydroxylase n=1 Tax=Pseudomonas TaxID=286 RepID=UPI001E3BE7DF|nr:bifunctional 3-(3-hydroxy-phenyl)propionate/3-hydroxycinnamic acid hydroxylase [Pseudomonas oryzagri]MCC6076068.1 bifunctional 3-(3-hydroxy-phenyl)propionate/3-hydroxycinnamic acid hydroxylase [Pseudomonas oryzagri]
MSDSQNAVRAESDCAHQDSIYDAIVVGYGPAGEVLASTIGAAGFRVLIVERWPEPYPLPRLTTLDGEVCRALQATSHDIDGALAETLVQESCDFVDAAGDPLMIVRYDGQLGGWPSRISVFQPDFEKAIADKVESMPNVDLLRGWEATELWQDANGVHLIISPTEKGSGKPRTIRAKYVVGTDGARSFVRQNLGLGVRDYDMHQRWLNFDAELLRPVPERFMKLKIFMDPERPHMYMPIGTKRLRLEFRVMEGETDEAMTDPAVAWEFMARKHGIGPEDVRILRQVVYHYRTRIATEWRVGRVFLAGDAAHTMPPYMGQGACAAIRDGRNLGWKLVEVLAGRSNEDLLDTYREEREQHVTTIVLASDRLSRVVNIVDPQEAAQRDHDMRLKGEGHPPALPSLQSGALFFDPQGALHGPAGEFAPQGRLRKGSETVRGDELLGSGFQLWCRQDPTAHLGQEEAEYLESLGCSIAVFEDSQSKYAVEDVDGVYVDYLNQHDVEVLLLRPDFYVFGAATATRLNTLVRSLADRLYSTASLATAS